MTTYPPPGLDYLIVDVFVGPDGEPYAGNPLAVVLGGDDLTTSQCQRLAAEFHLSETAFPIAPTTAQAHYRVRIFTIASELAFAGHPSIGTAWVLGRLGRLSPGHIIQECGAGLVSLEVPADSGAVTLTGPPPSMSGPIDPAPLLAAVSLTSADLVGPPARSGGSGISFAYLCVRSDALERARPDLAAMSLLPAAITGIYFFAVDDRSDAQAPLQVRARMFAPDIGGEDPATGSAALGLGGWLVTSGLAAADGVTAYAITQGVETGRPSDLLGDVTTDSGEITRVRVSGRVAEVARGRIRVP